MRFLVIVGSSRKWGTSSFVIDKIKNQLQGEGSIDIVWLSDYQINFCDGDNACAHKPCIIKDDVASIVNKMLDADAIIYMPVMHAYGTNSIFQAFLERVGYGFLRPLKRPLKDKLAIIVVVGRRYGHTSVYSQIVLNILLNKMILVGSGFPITFHSQLESDKEAEISLSESIERVVDFFKSTHEKKLNTFNIWSSLLMAEQLSG